MSLPFRQSLESDIQASTELPTPLEIEEPTQGSVESDTQAWDLITTLHLAVDNASIVRRDADFLSGSNAILDNPNALQTTYDPAIARSGFLFGNRGTAAALADFDSQLEVIANWQRGETVQNNRFLSGGILPGGTLIQESAQFISQISKQTTTGGRLRLFHTWDYNGSNQQDLLFQSVYQGTLGAEYRQPLLAGAGRRYTSIAGPVGDNVQGITGVSQGVLLTHFRDANSRLQFQKSLQELLLDTTLRYWNCVATAKSRGVYAELIDNLVEMENKLKDRIAAGSDATRGQLLEVQD
ncbi:MAG: hypothetical protein AAFP69_21570, partial [Planctomycetota bacterium]